MLGPLAYVIIQLLFITILLNAVFRIVGLNSDSGSSVAKIIIDIIFPILLQIAMLFNANLFCLGLVYEREHMIRYLLNF